MTIAENIIGRSGGLLGVSAEKTVSDMGLSDQAATLSHMRTNSWSMFDNGSVEVEVAEFLFALIRVIKPKQVLETGSYFGVSGAFIAEALKANGSGRLTSIERHTAVIPKCRQLWNNLEVTPWIYFVQADSMSYSTEDRFQVMFLDSEPSCRFQELEKFYENLSPEGYVVIHDLHRHMGQVVGLPQGDYDPWTKLPDSIRSKIESNELRVCHFPTPRGLCLLYKKGPNDYSGQDIHVSKCSLSCFQ